MAQQWLGPVTGAVGTLLGLALEGHNDRRQIRQQQKLTDMQVSAQNNLADRQAERQLSMWKATGPTGQMEQLKLAGLNPALMYGMGGGTGGQSLAGSPSVGGGNAPGGGNEVLASTGMGMQIGLMAAQKANIEADTKVKEATAAKTSGIDTTKATTENQNAILDGIIKKYAGLEAKDVYEQIRVPNRGIEAKTWQNELEARQGVADNIYNLWKEGKLADKSNEEIEQLVINNAKGRAERKNIEKQFDILEENLKGQKLNNVILELESKLQTETGLDKTSAGWLKVLGRLWITLTQGR